MIDLGLEHAADALRRYEMTNKMKNLRPWHHIAESQRKKWRAKVQVVLDAHRTKPTPEK